MKLFTVGPAEMYPSTLNIRKNIIPYFRTNEFSEMNLESAEMMKRCSFASDEDEVIFLTASGSAAMEAAVINCFTEKDKLLIISGGTFGERFERICQIHKIPFAAIKLGIDEQLEEKHFSTYENKGFTGLLVNLHETYTGQLYDIKIIKEFCKRNSLYLMVDAISTFMCDEYNMRDNDIDVTIVSSQKGLCLSPGLSVVILSKKIVEERVIKNEVASLYFDFKDYISNMKRGQTPYTPAVGILFELNDMLKLILKSGVESRLEEVRSRTLYFRKRIESLPVDIPKYKLSNAITPIRFRKNVAMQLFNYLKDEKGLMINPVGGELGKNSIRVAHIGALEYQDYDILLKEIRSFLIKENAL